MGSGRLQGMKWPNSHRSARPAAAPGSGLTIFTGQGRAIAVLYRAAGRVIAVLYMAAGRAIAVLYRAAGRAIAVLYRAAGRAACKHQAATAR